MALIAKVDPTATAAARQTVEAINLFRACIGKLESLDGLRAQSIGVSAAEVQMLFGVEDATQAQALSDRWAAFLAAYNGGTITVVSDFFDAFSAS